MKIKELKKAIENLPDDMELLLQDDDEGNGYSHLYGIDTNAICLDIEEYNPEKIYHTKDTASENCVSEEEWEEILTLPRVGILF